MSEKLEIGKKYYGTYPVLSYDWTIRHNEDDICTVSNEKPVNNTYYLLYCIYDNATYMGSVSYCRCDKCNRLIKNGYKFVDADGYTYCYGPECVKDAIRC